MATKNITVSFSPADQKLLARLVKDFGVKVSVTHVLRVSMQALAEKRGV